MHHRPDCTDSNENMPESAPWQLDAFPGALIVSPHSDDAAFSMGVLLCFLCRHLPRVEIVNCFSVSAYAGQAVPPDAVAVTQLRKAEDKCLAELLGPARPIHHYLDLADAPLRPGRGFHNLHNGRILSGERACADQIHKAVCALLAPDALLLYPLAVGRHIDHMLARTACDSLARGHAAWACYEDQPYRALSANDNLWPLNRGKVSFLFSQPEGKEDLLDCYPSQLLPVHRAAMLRYARDLGGPAGHGERFWTRARP